MKVLMFGWEFPPFKSGGLGTACYDLTKGLSSQDVDVTFVMPYAPKDAKADFVKIIGTNNLSKNIKIKSVKTILTPYQTFESYNEVLVSKKLSGTSDKKEAYGKNLYEEVQRYSLIAAEIAKESSCDVIHVHDWMTYKAGIIAKQITGKPLVAHIHATEFDRTGGNPNQIISHIEFEGLQAADVVIANSNWTKQNVINSYKIDPNKIEVVHWGIDNNNPYYGLNQASPFQDEKIILFLGRITIQKGPEYFVKMARKVVDFVPNTKFVVAGSGDMFEHMVNMAVDYGIADKFVFTGFLKGADVHRAFQMAHLYVMPSVSEPFGLVALEALKNNTPIMISRQSGASEVINHAFKVDFWDVDEMANKAVNILLHPELYEELKENSYRESAKFNLEEPARKTKAIYEKAIQLIR